jgi:hypothetical protein
VTGDSGLAAYCGFSAQSLSPPPSWWTAAVMSRVQDEGEASVEVQTSITSTPAYFARRTMSAVQSPPGCDNQIGATFLQHQAVAD